MTVAKTIGWESREKKETNGCSRVLDDTGHGGW